MATSNFSVLSQHDEQLLHQEVLAEKYFADDPDTCLLKLRQLTESLAQLPAARTGLFISERIYIRSLDDGSDSGSDNLRNLGHRS